jgi:hypothetical protein
MSENGVDGAAFVAEFAQIAAAEHGGGVSEAVRLGQLSRHRSREIIIREFGLVRAGRRDRD